MVTLIRQIMEYGSSAWFPYTKSKMTDIEYVQGLGSRMVPEVRKLTYPERRKALEMFTLEFRRSRGDQIMMYKVIVCGDIPEVAEYFKLAVEMPTHGHCFKLVVQRTDGLPHVYRLSRHVVNAWNNLPPTLLLPTHLPHSRRNTTPYLKHDLYRSWECP
ncbi:unnamed protein product [Dibothriocephalus latus]|uniref:Uncharacterized protein n=1 Tax=Dibothriocephalus latus TaxID=60516 RepID=A0A3P7NZL3_DIBLA|nr:unnamed protein product [Dibothriocephalus latus]